MENKECRCDPFYKGGACGTYAGCPHGITQSICDELIASHNIDKTNLPNPPKKKNDGLFSNLSMNTLWFIIVSVGIGLLIMLISGMIYCCCRRRNGTANQNQAPNMQIILSSSGRSLNQTTNTMLPRMVQSQVNNAGRIQLPRMIQQPQSLVLNKNPSIISNVRVLNY